MSDRKLSYIQRLASPKSNVIVKNINTQNILKSITNINNSNSSKQNIRTISSAIPSTTKSISLINDVLSNKFTGIARTPSNSHIIQRNPSSSKIYKQTFKQNQQPNFKKKSFKDSKSVSHSIKINTNISDQFSVHTKNIDLRGGRSVKNSQTLKLNHPIRIASTTKNSQNNDRSKSFKNLKINSIIQFSKCIGKSTSQTTMNKNISQRLVKNPHDNQRSQHYTRSRLLQKLSQNSFNNFQKSTKKNFGMLGQNLQMSDFHNIQPLGNGRFGKVYLCLHRTTGMLVAIKCIQKQKVKQARMVQQLVTQIKLSSYFKHPNLIQLYGFFSDYKNIYLVMQYCQKCLFKQVRTRKRNSQNSMGSSIINGAVSQQEAGYWARQAISGLKYMHNVDVMHRDIKPQNILLQFGVLKLSDFGWSTYSPLYKRQTFCGTPDYLPPEIVQGQAYDQSVDVWALGVLLYQLVGGKAPFQNANQNKVFKNIVGGVVKYPQHFSKQLKNLLERILTKNPQQRPNLQQIQRDSWFEKYKTSGRFICKEVWRAWQQL